MNRRIVPLALLTCATLAPIGILLPQVAKETQASFPLAPGSYWFYRGTVRSEAKNLPNGRERQVNWKMSVIRAVSRGGLLVVLVDGFPSDLDWSEGDAQPKRSILIRTSDRKFYLKGPPDLDVLSRKMDDPHFAIEPFLTDDDWFLQLPLVRGRKFCDEDTRKRDDGMYCWVVGNRHPASLEDVKGAPAGKRVAYDISYRTNPDDTEIEFIEGVGIARYSYHHHGTIADTELRLAEFQIGESKVN